MSLSGAARTGALLALSAALTAACGSSKTATASSSTTAGASVSTTAAGGVDNTRDIDVEYANGEVTGGVRTETVRVGDKVRLRVTSDVAEEVHVHTYDIMKDVAAGQTAEIDLTATIPGRHDVELEKKGKPLLVLEVK